MPSSKPRQGAYRERGRVTRALRTACRLTSCLLLAGCFTLAPVRLDRDLDPGRVRVHLTDDGAGQVASVLGRRADVVDAELVGSSADGIVILVPSAGAARFGGDVLYQELLLAKDDITGMQRRKLDRTRTGLVIGGAGAAVGLLLYQVLSGKSGGGVDGGVPGPSESRIPIFRFHLP